MTHIKIKDKLVPFPTHTNKVLWSQGRKLFEMKAAKDKEGSIDTLTHIEVTQGFLGESEDFWRSYQNVSAWSKAAQVLYQIWLNLQVRPMRTSLRTIVVLNYMVRKESRFQKFWRWFKSLFRFVDKYHDPLPYNKIEFEGKKYNCLPDLAWSLVGQKDDALELLKYLHEETETIHQHEILEKIFKIYFYPIVSGKPYKVEDAMEWDISGARYVDVVDFGNFFLLKLNAFRLGINSKARK